MGWHLIINFFEAVKKLSYSSFLKKAQQVQDEDEVELDRALMPLHKTVVTSFLDFSRTKEGGELNPQRSLNTSKSQEEQYRQALEAEKLARELFKQEISSIHVSGIRDKNTK